MNYLLVGYGRMGREIEAQAAARGHRRAAVVDPAAAGAASRIDAAALRGVEVAFEFSQPDQAHDNVLALVTAAVPVVCGTTGWTVTPELRAAVEAAGTAAVIAPNFSVGMNLFYRIVEHAAELLGQSGLYDPFVVEQHHRAKLDSPSGTARKLAELIAAADPREPEPVLGDPGGALPGRAVHVVGVRAGHEPGTHLVGFDGEHDVIRVEHRARGRSVFALGAVLAAEWVVGRSGIHGFDSVLDDLLAGRGGGPGATMNSDPDSGGSTT